MPFTFAHPAIVLPLGKLTKRWFSLTGLIIGSMTPDFEYFIRMKVKSIYSHTLTGLFWFDLPLGLVLVFIYLKVVKNPLIDHLPMPLKTRFFYLKSTANGFGFTWKYLIILSISILIGAATHLLWDGFTHPTGYFVSAIPVLTSSLAFGNHQVHSYKVLQHLSTLFGLTAIIITIFKLPKHRQVPTINVDRYWILIVLTIITTLAMRLLTGLSYQQYGHLVVTAIAGLWLGLLLSSLLAIRKKAIH